MKQIIEIVDVLGREILDSRGNPHCGSGGLFGGRHHGPRRRALRRFHRHL